MTCHTIKKQGLDEPIGNLESKTGKEIMELFRKIYVTYGKTLIQVTHSSSSSQYGTSIIRLVDGEIIEQSDIALNPLNAAI